MSCPTPGPEDVWFPPSCLARSYRSAGWRAPVPPCGIPALCSEAGALPPHPEVLCLPCHFLHEVRLRGAVDLNTFPTSLWVASRSGRVLILSFGPCVHPTAKIFMEQQQEQNWGFPGWCSSHLCSQPSFEFITRGRSVCVCESVGQRGRDRHRDRQLGTQTGDYTGELGYVSAWCDGSFFLSCYSLHWSQGHCHPTYTEYLLCSNHTLGDLHICMLA